MKTIKIFLIFGLIFLVLPIVLATTSTFPVSTALDYRVICSNNGSICSSPAICNFTLFYPNQTTLINNKLMTNQTSYHNYTLSANQLASFGEYCGYASCNDAGLKKDSTFCFKITPNGEPSISDNFLVFLYVLFVATIFILIYLLIMNIAKLATYQETVLGVAFSWAIYFSMMVESWIIANYSTSNLLRDNIGVFLTITAFTHVVLPLISLIITMFIKSTQAKRPLSVQEFTGGKFI